MPTQWPEMRTDARHEQDSIDEGLVGAAQHMIDNPNQLEILQQYMNGEIHRQFGASLVAQQRNGMPDVVFWNEHGTYVAPNGAIYHLRTDDTGKYQMFMSAVDGRGDGLRCIRPYTYDGHTSPDGTVMRADFVNGAHRTAPRNTMEDARILHDEGRDMVAPRHKEIAEANRDSLSLIKHDDGRTEAVLHDSIENSDTGLYSPDEVVATILILMGVEGDVHQLTAASRQARIKATATRNMGGVGVREAISA